MNIKHSKISIGVDFGTAHTYFAKENGDGKAVPRAWGTNDLDLHNKILETAVLYEPDGAVRCIGRVAVAEHLARGESEGLTLRYWFKPEIATDAKAKQAAYDFLAGAVRNQAARNDSLFPDGAKLIIGVPAERSPRFEEALRWVFAEYVSNPSQIEFVSEPIGALVSLLCDEKIELNRIREGILVVDFGGGTCDFFLIRGAAVRDSWCDSTLGGRLVDDVFYNIVLARYPEPDKIKNLSKRNKKTLQHLCCEKEKITFSNQVRERRLQPQFSEESTTFHIGDYLERLALPRTFKITYSDFLDAAESYTPSDVMMEFFMPDTEFGKDLLEMSREPTNLIERFRKALLKSSLLRKENVKHVYLAGGSSPLPFVQDVLKEELGDDISFFALPTDPYVIIANGLALLPYFRERCSSLCDELNKNKDRFIHETTRPVIEWITPRLEKASGMIAKIVATDVLDPILAHAKSEYTTKEEFETAYKNAHMPSASKEQVNEVNEGLKDDTKEFLDGKLSEWIKEVSAGRNIIGEIDFCHGDTLHNNMVSHASEPLPDSIGMALGSVLVGTLGGAEILAKLGMVVLFDPTGTGLVVGGIMSVVLAMFTWLPVRRRWAFRRFVESMQVAGKRDKVVKRMERQLHKKLFKEQRRTISKHAVEGLLRDSADRIIHELKDIGEALNRTR